MRNVTLLVLAALCICSSSAKAAVDDSNEAKVAQFWKRLAASQTVCFTVRDWQDDLTVPATDGDPPFIVANTYEVTAARPNKMRVLVSPGIERETTRQGGRARSYLFDSGHLYIDDGKTSIECMTRLHTYTMGKGMASLESDHNGTAYAIKAYWLFSARPLEGYKLVTKAGQGTLITYSYTDPKYPKLLEQIYFDRATGNLNMFSTFSKGPNGKWMEMSRKDFDFWDFDPPLPADTFEIKPPRTYISMSEFGRLHHIDLGGTKNQGK